MRRSIVLGGLGLIVLVGIGVMLLKGKTPSQENTRPTQARSIASDPSPLSQGAQGMAVDVVTVVSRNLERTIQLTGELHPYLRVDIYPKVTGIVERIDVDRGSIVKTGDPLLRLSAPELRAQRIEAEAQLRAAQITYSRLQEAALTPGVVAGNDLELAQHNKDAMRARVQSLREMEKYLHIVAPFDGVIIQRNVHPGAVVGPPGGPGGEMPALKLEQISHLRLVVPVPEMYSGSIAQGASVPFTVPAYPEESFTGSIARVSRSVDQETRTMPVEIDVPNPKGRLAAGMFPEVYWPIRRTIPTLFVPISSVATTTEQTFVVRVKHNEAEWVPVKKGTVMGNQVEVFGSLQAGDQIFLRGTDEVRPGAKVVPTLIESKNSS